MTRELNEDDIEDYSQPSEEQLRIYQFYENNAEKIESLEHYVHVSQVIAIIGGFMFFLLVTIILSLKTTIEHGWIYAFISMLISSVCIALAVNLFLYLTIVYSEQISLATWMSYFSVNICTVNFLVFLVLFSLNLDGVINISWKLVSIPLYIIIGMSLFYFVFMLPAFIHTKSFWEIALITSLLVNILAFSILLNARLDDALKISYVLVFIPAWFLAATFWIYYIYQCTVKKKPLWNVMIIIFGLGFMTSAVIIVPLNLDKLVISPNVVPCLMTLFAYILFFIEKLYSNLFHKSMFDSGEMEKEKEMN